MEMFYYYNKFTVKNPKLMIKIMIKLFIAFIDSLSKNQLLFTSVNLYYLVYIFIYYKIS